MGGLAERLHGAVEHRRAERTRRRDDAPAGSPGTAPDGPAVRIRVRPIREARRRLASAAVQFVVEPKTGLKLPGASPRAIDTPAPAVRALANRIPSPTRPSPARDAPDVGWVARGS